MTHKTILIASALLCFTAMPALAEVTRADIRKEQQDAKENIRDAHIKAERDAREERRGMRDTLRDDDSANKREEHHDYVRSRNDGIND